MTIIRIDSATFRDWAVSGGVSVVRAIPASNREKKSRTVKRMAENFAGRGLGRSRGSGRGRRNRRLVTRDFAAAMLGVSTKTITRWRQSGVLPQRLSMDLIAHIGIELSMRAWKGSGEGKGE